MLQRSVTVYNWKYLFHQSQNNYALDHTFLYQLMSATYQFQVIDVDKLKRKANKQPAIKTRFLYHSFIKMQRNSHVQTGPNFSWQ